MTTYFISKEYYADGPSLFTYVLTAQGTSMHMEFRLLREAKAEASAIANAPLTWHQTRKDDDRTSFGPEYTAEI